MTRVAALFRDGRLDWTGAEEGGNGGLVTVSKSQTTGRDMMKTGAWNYVGLFASMFPFPKKKTNNSGTLVTPVTPGTYPKGGPDLQFCLFFFLFVFGFLTPCVNTPTCHTPTYPPTHTHTHKKRVGQINVLKRICHAKQDISM
jgi:hypothetical protein